MCRRRRAAHLPSPNPGFSPGSSHGPSRILCNPRTPLPRAPFPQASHPAPLGAFLCNGGVSWQMAEPRGGGGGGGRGRPGGGCWQGVAAVTEIGSGWLLAVLHGIGFMVFFCRGRGDLWLFRNYNMAFLCGRGFPPPASLGQGSFGAPLQQFPPRPLPLPFPLKGPAQDSRESGRAWGEPGASFRAGRGRPQGGGGGGDAQGAWEAGNDPRAQALPPRDSPAGPERDTESSSPASLAAPSLPPPSCHCS